MGISRKVRFEFDPFEEFGITLKSTKSEALDAIADYIHESILSAVGDGDSPVKGEHFKKLNKKYAQIAHDGDRSPRLELEGDLLDSIRVESKRSKIIVGVEEDEEEKADGHNQLTSKAKAWAEERDFPKRRFIPDEGQQFSSEIMDGIESILNDYADQEAEDQADET